MQQTWAPKNPQEPVLCRPKILQTAGSRQFPGSLSFPVQVEPEPKP